MTGRADDNWESGLLGGLTTRRANDWEKTGRVDDSEGLTTRRANDWEKTGRADYWEGGRLGEDWESGLLGG
jgi:hypothetical protein